jgi:competence ComEA-like helix-hairpin-helix protein
MNRRERAILLLVTVAFLVGVGVSYYRRAGLSRQAALSPIAVVRDTAVGLAPDLIAVPRPVDLNRATPHQLDGLPGIGPVLASRIVEYRQRKGCFHIVSELRAVSGIGEKRYSELKDLVTVGSPDAAVDSGR